MTEGTPVPQPERLTPSPEGTYELTTPGFTIKATVTGGEFTKIIYSPAINLEELDQNLQGAPLPSYEFIITQDLKNNTTEFSIRFGGSKKPTSSKELIFKQTGDNLLLVRKKPEYIETPLTEIADGKFKLYGDHSIFAVQITKKGLIPKEGLITVSYLSFYRVEGYEKLSGKKLDLIINTAKEAALLVAAGGGRIEIPYMFAATMPADLNLLTPPNREELLELLQGLYDSSLNTPAAYSVRLARTAAKLEYYIKNPRYRQPTEDEINQINDLLKIISSEAKEQWDKSLQTR